MIFKLLPIFFIGLIYFPASLLGLVLFQDQEAVEMLLLLLLFFIIYVSSYELFSKAFLCLVERVSSLINVSSRGWYCLSFLALFFYIISLAYTVYLADSVPVIVALKGGGVMEIAESRSGFLAGLDGYESILRYAVFILGRSVMPLILVAAFVYKYKFKYWLLFVLFVLSALSLEKAASIYIFLPCVLYFSAIKCWSKAIAVTLLMLMCIGGMTVLAFGGGSQFAETSSAVGNSTARQVFIPADMPIQEAMGQPGRFYLPDLAQAKFKLKTKSVDVGSVSGKLLILLNRIVWIPYVTAYDWLGFHRVVLNGELTLGRSVSLVHLFYGEPKMLLEKMVYVYEFGASPGGAGASNTVFFVDAKLAFGWGGVVLYCLFFTFFSACIFSSGNQVLMVSSVVCFFVASVSSLTATLLSGGLFIYVVLSFLLYRRKNAGPVLSKGGE